MQTAAKAPLIERRRGPPRVKFDPPLHARYMSIDGTWWHDCLIIDTSQTGAQIEVTEPITNVTEFFLMLSATTPPVHRRCRIVWYNGNRLGVEYQKAPGHSTSV